MVSVVHPVAEKGSYNFTCKRCKQKFFTTRPQAKYCTSACRVLDCNVRKGKLLAALAMPEKTLKDCKAKLKEIASNVSD